MNTVFFAPKMEGYNSPYDHPLFEDEVYINPICYLDYYKDQHKNHSYWRCPAWQNSFKNAFVFFSQIDIEIDYNKNTGIIKNEAFRYCTFDEGNPVGLENFSFDGPPIHRPPAPYNGVAIGQINQHFVFWTEEKFKNIWLEIMPTPNMLSRYGAELIGGEFPFSRWYRPSLFAFKFHQEKVVIKRGDPLGIIRFKNLDNYLEDIKLQKACIPNNLIRKSLNHALLKIFLPNKSWSLIKDPFKNVCPSKWGKILKLIKFKK